MNKKDILQQLKNNRLTAHERETLSQLLHYLTVEGLNSTSSNNNNNTNNTSSSRSSKHPSVKSKKTRPRNTTSSNTR